MKNDDMLSQDEIDALLKGTVNDAEAPNQEIDDVETQQEKQEQQEMIHTEDYLTPVEEDALGEIGNISFGSSATALSSLLNQKVDITTPSVSIIPRSKIQDEFPHPYVAILVEYRDGFAGVNLLVIKQQDAAIIADLMLGGTGENPSETLDDIKLSAVQEAMNQMMGSAATSMSTIFQKRVDISPPSLVLMDLKNGEGSDAIPDHELFVKVSFRLTIGNLIDSNIMQLLPISFAKSLVEELVNPSTNGEEPQMANEENVSDKSSVQKGTIDDGRKETVSKTDRPQPDVQKEENVGKSRKTEPMVHVEPAAFAEFQPTTALPVETRNLDLLLDIPLNVTVELGRTVRTVKDILELSSGSIIELDKLAGEPVDILVNNRLIAKGEVVVIDENFGVRITEIQSQSERIHQLK
ncbi:flagellar motor switch phosphatase FliY [Bacillus smithii]|uniref:flagellar motor switch phosphatase FliY n=1 Tax=Bacillus smithii TaxID=1479 RepID=UPI003D243F13